MSIKSRLLLIVFAAALIAYGEYYRMSYQSEKVKYEQSKRDYQALNTSFQDYKEKNQTVHIIDTQGQEELNHVKTENDYLRYLLRNHLASVYVNSATAPEMRESPAPCVVNDTRPRLNDSAQQDFLDLKERAEQSIIKIEGLQRYINEVCLKSKSNK